MKIPLFHAGCDIYPSYNHKLLKDKLRCYPHEMKINDSEACVELQNLVEHTSYRLLQTLDTTLPEECTVLYKWGFDGSSGHSEYKQLFAEDSMSQTDASLLNTTLVPVRIVNMQGEVIWKNDTPSSTR